MTNPFSGRAAPASGPATDIVAVTPDDSADLPRPAIALYVEAAGTVAIDTVAGDATRVVSVAANMLLPVAAVRVRATGTTASGIHALVIG